MGPSDQSVDGLTRKNIPPTTLMFNLRSVWITLLNTINHPREAMLESMPIVSYDRPNDIGPEGASGVPEAEIQTLESIAPLPGTPLRLGRRRVVGSENGQVSLALDWCPGEELQPPRLTARASKTRVSAISPPGQGRILLSPGEYTCHFTTWARTNTSKPR